jgi:uridine kinase
MLRRLVRDYLYRGHDAQKTIRDWPKVRAGEFANIFPYNSKADVLFNSAHIYELAVLKKYAAPLLESINRKEEEYAEARRMLDFLRFFQIIEDETIIPNHSILREFIGGSVFVEG